MATLAIPHRESQNDTLRLRPRFARGVAGRRRRRPSGPRRIACMAAIRHDEFAIFLLQGQVMQARTSEFHRPESCAIGRIHFGGRRRPPSLPGAFAPKCAAWFVFWGNVSFARCVIRFGLCRRKGIAGGASSIAQSLAQQAESISATVGAPPSLLGAFALKCAAWFVFFALWGGGVLIRIAQCFGAALSTGLEHKARVLSWESICASRSVSMQGPATTPCALWIGFDNGGNL